MSYAVLRLPNQTAIVKTAKKVFNVMAMIPNHSAIRNDLIRIFAFAALLLLALGVLYWYDQRTEVLTDWSSQLYQFILRR